MRTSACKACGAAIVWIKTPTGKAMPCDASPRYYIQKPRTGTKKIVTPNGEVISCEYTDDPHKADFQRAAEKLERDHPGVVVINPAVLPEGMRAADYMSICIPMLYAADIAAFLPSYQESKGAKLEMALCEYIGKPHIILEAGDGLPCGSFVAIECVNGHCPDIPSEYDEQEYTKGIKCSECGYNTGQCKDCALPGSGACPKEEGDGGGQ